MVLYVVIMCMLNKFYNKPGILIQILNIKSKLSPKYDIFEILAYKIYCIFLLAIFL